MLKDVFLFAIGFHLRIYTKDWYVSKFSRKLVGDYNLLAGTISVQRGFLHAGISE